LNATGIAKPHTTGSRVYFRLIVALGSAVLAFSLYQVSAGRVSYFWLILASLTALSGGFTVPIPGVPSKISVAESFIFTNLILFGPAAGALTAALDGFLSFLHPRKKSRQLQYSAFNMASLALSAYLAGSLFFLLAGRGPVFQPPPASLRQLFLPALLMALLHYLANTGSVALIIALENHNPFLPVWLDRFRWTSVTYFAGASAATLIAANAHRLTPALVAVSLPTIFVTYFAFRSYLDKERENAHHQELDRLYLKTVETLSVAIDARESGTLGQARCVQIYARGLARAAGISNPKELRGIEAAALLLDIGNLAVPESILNNPGELSPAEFQKIMTHPVVGANILSAIDFPYPLADYVRHHHERWDGSGYPDQLQGPHIPLGARILAIADSFAALTCDRPYQKARPHSAALLTLQAGAGSRHDPLLVDTFTRVSPSLIAETLALESHPHAPPSPPNLLPSPPSASPQPPSSPNPYHDISSTRKEVAVLHDLALELAATLNLPETLSIIAAMTAKLVPFTSCSIFLYPSDRTFLQAHHSSGANAHAFQGLSLDPDESLSACVASRRHPVINASAAPDLTPIQSQLESPLSFALIHPLIFDDRCLGTLSLYASPNYPFKDDDLRIVASICQKAAPAIQNARMYGQAQQEAAADPLTRLPNIRYLRRYLAQEIAKSKRYGHPLSVLGMDLDGFKTINDSYGHQAGDRILVEVARILKSSLRQSDLLARYGGDEFVAALFDTGYEEAAQLASRLQKEIESLHLEASPGKPVRVGISIGCASYPVHGSTMEELLHAADAEMYRNKRERAAGSLAAVRG